MLTTIVCGDPHFKVDNIPEVNMFMDRFEQLIIDKKPDFCVVLGDLLHTHERLHTTALNKAYELIHRLRKHTKTFVLVGNHDMCNNSQYLTTNHWMNAMKEWNNVTIVDTVIHDTINGFHLVFCPYVPPGRLQEALDSHETKWTNADCIFIHQEMFGCKMGSITSVDGDKWPINYPEIVSGHIHSRQSPQENIYYPGSAMQHAFGESEKNIIAILTWDNHGTKYNLEEIDLELPRKRIVYTDVESMEDYAPPKSEDKIKITISGVYDQFKAFKKTKKYRELVKNGTAVVFKPKKISKKQSEEKTEQIDETSFNSILTSLVTNEKNKYLYQAYELVVNDKHISEQDIFFA